MAPSEQPYRPPVLSHPRDGVFPVPLPGSPLADQPRAVSALLAFDEGLNLLIGRPALFGLLPCGVLVLRLAILLLALLAASAFGFDWWMWQTLGQSPFRLPEGTWAAFALVVAALIAAEHATIHLLLACLPRSLRGQPWRLDEVFTAKTLCATALLRFATYVAVGVGLILLGLGTALALPLVLAPFYAADRGLGIFAACHRSSAIVLRHFGTVLLFEFISWGLLLCGLLLCGVGLFPAYVVVTASRAALYEQLTGAMPTHR